MSSLPTIKADNGQTYILDLRLRQLRNFNNPHDFIDFADTRALDDWLDDHMVIDEDEEEVA